MAAREVVKLRPRHGGSLDAIHFENRLVLHVVNHETVGGKNQRGRSGAIERSAIPPKIKCFNLLIARKVRDSAPHSCSFQDKILSRGRHILERGSAPSPLYA